MFSTIHIPLIGETKDNLVYSEDPKTYLRVISFSSLSPAWPREKVNLSFFLPASLEIANSWA